MEKLTLEQLAPYLPYGLKVSNKINLSEYGICKNTIERLDGFVLGNVLTDMDEFDIKYCILHLRPLSDLTKEITHNGETFVPIENIAIYSPTNQGLSYLIEQIKTGFIEVIVFNKLIEWHFDVFGLIGKELAIDLNTIK
jgi:hypothetical protein